LGIKIENTFVVPLSVPEAWTVLLDVKRVIACMPGAELTEVVDERTFRVLLKAKLGPVALAFKGTGKLEEVDEAARRIRIKASGNETSGRGGAQADIVVDLAATGEGTTVKLGTDLALTGAVAQYGRGLGMIQDVSKHLIGKFSENLRVQIQGTEEERRKAEAKSGEAISALEMAKIGLAGGVRRIFGGEEKKGEGDSVEDDK
jgi:carbon monoxide dehydrogenase subunit G